jgi:prolyl-tRNA synthetase
MFLSTFKEVPKDATIESHILMLRAGFINKHASGIYSYLPLGLRVLEKLKKMLNSEIEKTGAQEVALPYLILSDLWKESGRYEKMGDSLFKLKDRHNIGYLLGPTHEESMVELIKGDLKSYKQLPINLFQTKRKFRDEIRPRYGVMRGREFTMMDGYSFHTDEDSLNECYLEYKKAYQEFFKKCHLDVKIVVADSGNMGGSISEEFMVKSHIGDDTILECPECGYIANQEKAKSFLDKKEQEKIKTPLKEKKEVHTPNIKTMQDLEHFFKGIPLSDMVKCVCFKMENGKIVLALVRGDKAVNEAKLTSFLLENLSPLKEEEISQYVGPVGFLGPVAIKDPSQVMVVADTLLEGRFNLIVGANKSDTHYQNVSVERDFPPTTRFADITQVAEGDLCGECLKGHLKEFKGIEVGHIFKLGQGYAQSMKLTYTAFDGKSAYPTMGCYGLGVDRTFAAIVDQHHDEVGVIFPYHVAPYHISILVLDKEAFDDALKFYESLSTGGFEVLLDERDVAAGVKFKDADLLGIPLRITFGKNYKDGLIGLKLRREKQEELVNLNEATFKIKEKIKLVQEAL